MLGLGRIGKEFAAPLPGIQDARRLSRPEEQPYLPYVYYKDLEAMARDVDWLVCIAPGGEATQGIISRKVLEALGPKGCLVNIGRGSSVDEPAMVEMLQSGALGGAALDVFADEPNVPRRCSPSTTSSSRRTRARPRTRPAGPWATWWCAT